MIYVFAYAERFMMAVLIQGSVAIRRVKDEVARATECSHEENS